MEGIEAHTSPSDGTDTGVAPPSVPVKPHNCHWLIDKKSGWQFGETGVIRAIFDEVAADIPEEHRWAVEFGAGDGDTLPLTCDPLLRERGWNGLLIDADMNKCVKLRERVPTRTTIVNGIVDVSPGNTIDEYLEKFKATTSPALMVVDVDSIEYHIVAGMKARPYVLCVEHMNDTWPAHPHKPLVPDREDCGKAIPGPELIKFTVQATYEAVEELVSTMGYKPVFKTIVNGIYVRDDIWVKIARPDDGKIRLNIGAGKYNDPRYVSVDIKDGIDARKLPYADNSVDEIYASHVLEHFPCKETASVLAEWARVLKPSGLMRIAVPDAEHLIRDIPNLHEDGNYDAFEAVFFGGEDTETGRHKALFTTHRLRERMNEAGIGFVTKFKPFIHGDCANAPCSLNLEGIKRYWPKIESPVVTLVLNQPRLAFTGHEIRLVELAKRLNFNLQTCSGSFWDRDMSSATATACATGDPDFLIYSDYDSIFEVEDVVTLLETINNDPYMAAIGAVQMSRHNDRPLVFEDHIDYSTDISRVRFQHFGLMVVRRNVFDELEQPWFWSIPGKNFKGDWDWDGFGRSDADITFWRNLSLMGFRVYQHNRVCIGHIVQAIKYPRDKGKGVQLIPIENYWRHGRPKDVKFNAELYKGVK